MSSSPRLLALDATFFFFQKNLCIPIITTVLLVISVMLRDGKNNTDIEFKTNYSDSGHMP